MKLLTSKQKKLNKHARSANKEIRNILFATEYFELNAEETIQQAVRELNECPYQNFTKITRNKAEFYFSKIATVGIPFLQARTNSFKGRQILLERVTTFLKVEEKINELKKLPKTEQQEALDNLVVLPVRFEQKTIDGKTVNVPVETVEKESEEVKDLIIAGFTTTIDQNKELLQKQGELLTEVTGLRTELDFITAERKAREERRQKYKDRKRLEERHAIKLKHYYEILEEIGTKQTYLQARTRLGVTMLFISGGRVGEILFLEKKKVETLFQKQRPFLAFDRLKHGATAQKTFLNPEGAKIIKARKPDYELVLDLSVQENKYLFAAQNLPSEHLTRPHFTAMINVPLKKVGDKHNKKFSSHSF